MDKVSKFKEKLQALTEEELWYFLVCYDDIEYAIKRGDVSSDKVSGMEVVQEEIASVDDSSDVFRSAVVSFEGDFFGVDYETGCSVCEAYIYDVYEVEAFQEVVTSYRVKI